MSGATGLGMIEVGLLESCARREAVPGAPYVKCQRLLETLYEALGVAPRIGYQVLCDMARPWISHLRLLDFHGNVGSPDLSAAAPKYTEARLTALGAAALAAERGRLGALPIGLINGTTHVDGNWPPLDPAGTVAALLAAISRLPPDVCASDICETLADLTTIAGDRIVDVNDLSTGDGSSRIVVRLAEFADPSETARELGELWGLHTALTVQLGRPLVTIVREWANRRGGSDLAERLALVTDAA